jgi:hypothetical protein
MRDEVAEGRRAATYALGVLTFINLFNYVDRWVVAAVVESIKRSELANSGLWARASSSSTR